MLDCIFVSLFFSLSFLVVQMEIMLDCIFVSLFLSLLFLVVQTEINVRLHICIIVS